MIDILEPVGVKKKPDKLSLWVLGAFGILVLLMQTLDYYNFAIDDVFISLRVASNVIDGHGFVYNVGQYIEGYSNWLWIVFFIGIARVLHNEWTMQLFFFSKALSYFFGLASLATLVVLVRRYFAERSDRTTIAMFAALLLIVCSPFIAWSISGLETTFCAFLFTFALLQSQRILNETASKLSFFLLGTSLLFLCLARPEPALHTSLLFAYLLYVLKGQPRRTLILFSILPFVVGYGIFNLWRIETYHRLLPNTFYAKTGGGMGSYILGLKYFFACAIAILGPLTPCVILLVGYGKRRIHSVSYLFLIATAIFTIYSGGDWMPGQRFLVPIAPILIFMGLVAAVKLYDILKSNLTTRSLFESRQSKLVVIALVLLVLLAQTFEARTRIRGEIPAMITGFHERTGIAIEDHKVVADWFRANVKGPFKVATGEAGIFGYINPNMELIDLNGLMDTIVSSGRKRDATLDTKYVFAQKPDFILLYGIDDPQGMNPHAGRSGNYTASLLADSTLFQRYFLRKSFPSFELLQRNDKWVAATK